jgi:MOSC domain-containing protein YiiM
MGLLIEVAGCCAPCAALKKNCDRSTAKAVYTFGFKNWVLKVGV